MGASGLNSLSPLGGAGGILGAGSGALGGVELSDKMADIADRISAERSAQSGASAPIDANQGGCGGGGGSQSTSGTADVARVQNASRSQAHDLPETISGNKTLGEVASEHGATPTQVMNALHNGTMSVADSSSSAGAE